MIRLLPPLLLVAVASVLLAADPPKEKPKGKPNRLAKESSPYLLQHAHNPVDWFPWGPEAFAKAKKEGKLVFLSIGYSSCHWCHVMERESFENADIAKTLNTQFVCVKVDREERPDVDEVYMTAVQVTGTSGGWPLSVFLLPDGKPIFGGTYFPPEDKKVGEGTLTGFKTILSRVTALYKDKKDDLVAQADNVAKLTAERLAGTAKGAAAIPLTAALVKEVTDEFELDPVHGGIGRALLKYRGTKFPRVAALKFLLTQAAKSGNEALAKLMTTALDQMAQGGIYDHLGGGFHRYSTERTWTVPHFEKMLYDNAQLVDLYAQAYQQKPNPAYKRVIDETLGFVTREMTAPDGYFYSALDADSDGEEGKFYVWTAKELKAILGPDAGLVATVYGTDKPNFEEKYSILRLSKPLADTAKDLKLTEAELLAKLAPLKAKLLAARGKRNRPFLDTKLITGWNGQMIAAYAKAGKVLKNPEYVKVAEKAATFVLDKMTNGNGLYRTYGAAPGGKPTAKGHAFLDDYAYLAHGLLALHDATGEKEWLTKARQVYGWQTAKFTAEGGGYFNTPKDGEKLFARGKDSYDGAQPSANGVSLGNVLRLWKLTDDEGYRQRFEADLRRFAPSMKTEPTAVPQALAALDSALTLGALQDLPTRLAETAKNPTSSADVVKVSLSPGNLADGLETYEVTIYVAKGWHVYANPVGNDTLALSATVVEIRADGKKLSFHQPAYPKGVKKKSESGDYNVYEGSVSIPVVLSHDEIKGAKAMTAKVKLTACNDKVCLKPATVTATVK